MTSRGSWNVEDIEPSVREKAEAAARRAGMSLPEWLNASIGSPGNLAATMCSRSPSSEGPAAPQTAPDVTEIHQRLDTIARQIEAISRPADRDQPPVARQLNDAISRLDERLSRITAPKSQPQPQRPSFMQSAPAPQSPPAPARTSSALDNAIAEILARQSELEAARTPSPPPIASSTPAIKPDIDMSALERQLATITSRIEALHQPAQIDQAIASFRGELAEIRRAITEAMPRQAIESIERDVRLLSQRIDDSRHNGSDDRALAGVERALGQIRQALNTLTPAEQLAGFDEAIRGLGARLDTIVRSDDDPGTMQQLQEAIAALRGIVANVASNEALAQLSEQVRTLAAKVDQLARSDAHADSLNALEARIATLTSALESRPQRVADDRSEQIEGALRTLSERLDRLAVSNDGPSAFAHLEQRVSYLLERLEASADHRGLGLGRVEEGLQDILRHLERQQSHFAALENPAPAMDDAVVASIRRELSDIRHNQSETSRTTQDTLDAVHGTLGHVVDRLAMIENDLRAVRSVEATPPPAAMPAAASRPVEPPAPAPAPFVAPKPAAEDTPASPPPPPNVIRDILTPRPRVAPAAAAAPVAPPVETRAAPARATLGLDLPPDHPLEPGTRPAGRPLSPSERIAASESALSEIAGPGIADQPASTSSFIAAARRAAKAAAAAPAAETSTRAARLNDSIRAATRGGKFGSKIKSLLVGASVVVIVLGSFKLAMTWLDDQPVPVAAHTAISKPAPARPAPPATETPSITSPTPIDRQSSQAPAAPPSHTHERAEAMADHDLTPAEAAMPAPAATITATPAAEETGSLATVRNEPGRSEPAPAAPAATSRLSPIAIPASEKLPDAIGGPALRSAALKGDPAAAYEVAVRYAEGKGVAANFPEAAKWYERAAQSGVVLAMFRLGTFYEKGISVKKDFDIARRYYTMAAERGNAKAMHNLAVLEADGGGNGANYRSASAWFRKAADRGIADSQFNLGILYARGIGVEQNLAESFKWFSLAAAQGDSDAARKRDDVAKRLDPQSLAAAKLAVTSFTPQTQPDDAVSVATPPGGWDAAAAKTASLKPAARSVRASR